MLVRLRVTALAQISSKERNKQTKKEGLIERKKERCREINHDSNMKPDQTPFI
jgi:hypothetical protein